MTLCLLRIQQTIPILYHTAESVYPIIMVRLASIEHKGKIKLVAELADGGFCDLSSIAANARDFFLATDGVKTAKNAVATASEINPDYISKDGVYRRLAPIDGSLVGKFLCIGMNYKVCEVFQQRQTQLAILIVCAYEMIFDCFPLLL